ncbi:hypothetical protein [Streptomonospora sediminis]
MTNAPHHCCPCRMCSRASLRPRPRIHAEPPRSGIRTRPVPATPRAK